MTTTHDLSPYEVAYLAGGAQRAVAAALASLRVAGAIGVRDGEELICAGHLPDSASALEKTVYDAVTQRRAGAACGSGSSCGGGSSSGGGSGCGGGGS